MNLDEELMLDAQQDAAAVAYIKQHLPQDLKDVFTEELLYYFIDVIVEYYTESGILDATPDKDGYIEIDEEAIAAHLAKKAKKEGMGNFSVEDLLFVVQAHMEFEEEQN